MYKNLDIFRMSHAMAVHAGSRQSVIARNMANADTPGYKAQDVMPFQAVLETDSGSFLQKATRSGHFRAIGGGEEPDVFDRPNAQADPNGNSVSVETEMLHAVDVKRQHDRAVTIYKSALGVLRHAISHR